MYMSGDNKLTNNKHLSQQIRKKYRNNKLKNSQFKKNDSAFPIRYTLPRDYYHKYYTPIYIPNYNLIYENAYVPFHNDIVQLENNAISGDNKDNKDNKLDDTWETTITPNNDIFDTYEFIEINDA